MRSEPGAKGDAERALGCEAEREWAICNSSSWVPEIRDSCLRISKLAGSNLAEFGKHKQTPDRLGALAGLTTNGLSPRCRTSTECSPTRKTRMWAAHCRTWSCAPYIHGRPSSSASGGSVHRPAAAGAFSAARQSHRGNRRPGECHSRARSLAFRVDYCSLERGGGAACELVCICWVRKSGRTELSTRVHFSGSSGGERRIRTWISAESCRSVWWN